MNIPLIFIIVSLLIVICAYLVYRYNKTHEQTKSKPPFNLDRHSLNPVISPHPVRAWEQNGTFNPAAVKDDEGKIHLLYRAQGSDGISRVGHASSTDGRYFDNRSPYPVYEPRSGYGMPNAAKVTGPAEYNPSFYTSGGGWGGSEDPRAVLIDGRVYMSYVAFEGWNSVRIALTSIKLDDLKKGKWNWRKPAIISPPNEVHKNWLIFPEKINGKFAILHGISPKILVDYVDNLDTLGGAEYIKSQPPKGGRKNFWDNWVRGAGPPPIKTELGWLVLYHAMDKEDPNRYKLGAMILDINNPTKVLYRSPQPILEPDQHYENDGKPGVVYASGAVVMGKNLMVYYGGGDKHVCIAETPLDRLLDWLTKYGKVS